MIKHLNHCPLTQHLTFEASFLSIFVLITVAALLEFGVPQVGPLPWNCKQLLQCLSLSSSEPNRGEVLRVWSQRFQLKWDKMKKWGCSSLIRWNIPEQSWPSSPRCEYPAAASYTWSWPLSIHWYLEPHDFPSDGTSVASEFLPLNVPGDIKTSRHQGLIQQVATEKRRSTTDNNKPLQIVGALVQFFGAVPSFS